MSAEQGIELTIIVTNLLVVVASLALFCVTYADAVKDTNRTLKDIVRMVLKAQRAADRREGRK